MFPLPELKFRRHPWAGGVYGTGGGQVPPQIFIVPPQIFVPPPAHSGTPVNLIFIHISTVICTLSQKNKTLFLFQNLKKITAVMH